MKNKSQLLIALFTTIFVLTSMQNLGAQDTSTPTKFVIKSGDTAEAADVKTSEAEDLLIEKSDPSRFNNFAIIQGLNKITAKTSLLEIKVGSSIRFGKLIISAHKCWQAALDQKPESKILLEILDDSSSSENNAKGTSRIFYGWMFSSSPSVSALEHPIYDITAVGCKNK